MNTRQIERSQWDHFLGQLSKQLLERPVTIEVISQDRGDQVLADHVPFLGIAPELKGTDACAVDIEVRRQGSTDSYMHMVPLAKSVMVEEDDQGRPLALDIESEDPESHVPVKTIVTWH